MGNLSGNPTHGHRAKPHGTVSLGITISTCTLGSGQREKRDLKCGMSPVGRAGDSRTPRRPCRSRWTKSSLLAFGVFLAAQYICQTWLLAEAQPRNALSQLIRTMIVLPRCPQLGSLQHQHLEIGNHSGEARYLGPYQLHLLLYSASKNEATRAQLALPRFETVLGV